MINQWSRVALGSVLACVLLSPAYSLAANTTLMVQQTPVDGGTVTPALGIHDFGVNSAVTVTATPRPGYQFVYWLGDVIDPTSQTTMATLDGPKIIVAVFERVQYEMLSMDAAPRSTPLGDQVASYQESGGGQSNGAVGGKRPHKFHWPDWPDDEEPDEDDFPVPDENFEDVPVPGPEVPEPATIALLAWGAGLILRCRRRTTRS